MTVNRTTLQVEQALHNALGTIMDSQTRRLAEAWGVAWEQTRAELEAAALELTSGAANGRVTRSQVVRNVRAQRGLEALGRSLDSVIGQTDSIAVADLRTAVTTAAQAEHDMIQSQLTGSKRASLAANLIMASPQQITWMVERATQRIHSLTRPLGAEAEQAMRRELLRGVTVGANPNTAARRMVRGLEDQWDGGLGRAMTISRTEMMDAARAAQQAVDKANVEVMTGWVWLAHLDINTCRSCVAMHGTIHDIDDPGPLDHQRGRCARVPKTKSWTELGFKGMTDPPDITPNADDWFAGLTADQQRGILGLKGYDAWKAGTYPREAWAARRSTSGWRDSYAPSRPGAAVPTPAVLTGEKAWSAAPSTSLDTDDEILAIRQYGHSSYVGLNMALRNGGGVPDRYAKAVSQLDDVIAKSALPSDINVYRGIEAVDDLFGRSNLLGLEFSDDGFLSTSTNAGISARFMRNSGRGALFEIKAPKGTSVYKFGDDDERELLFGRGKRIRVTGSRTERVHLGYGKYPSGGTNYDIDWGYDDVTVWEAEFID